MLTDTDDDHEAFPSMLLRDVGKELLDDFRVTKVAGFLAAAQLLEDTSTTSC